MSIESVLAQVKSREADNLAAYAKLVDALASGAIHEGDAAAVVLAARRGAADLERDVAWRRREIELVTEVGAGKAASERATEVRAEIDKLVAKREAAITKANEACAQAGEALEAELFELEAKIKAASRAESALQEHRATK